MRARIFHNRSLGKNITVRPLASGDTATVASLFERLSPASRQRRYHAAKPRLTSRELASLAQVSADRHVLVAYVDDDPLPAGMARLVRDASDRATGELAFEVADRYHGHGVGSLLVEKLLDDARAAGIRRLDAWVETSNRPALRLLGRLGRATAHVEGAKTLIVATVA